MRKVINDGGIYQRRMTGTLPGNRRADLKYEKAFPDSQQEPTV